MGRTLDEGWLAERGYALEGDRAVRRGSPHRYEQPHIPSVTARPPQPPVGTPRYRSKTEGRFADYLDQQRQLGIVDAWWYEPWKLWLTPHMTYTPDFVVQPVGPPIVVLAPVQTQDRALLTPEYAAKRLGDFHLICYEAKPSTGREYDPRRALDRLKMAAHLYPMFSFRLARWDRQQRGWSEEVVR